MSKLRTHYDNLQVKETAGDEVIKGAYKYLSQKWHPDKHENKEEAERVTKIINQAYAILSDPIQRREHDEWIRRQRDQQEAPEPPLQQPPAPEQSHRGEPPRHTDKPAKNKRWDGWKTFLISAPVCFCVYVVLGMDTTAAAFMSFVAASAAGIYRNSQP